MRMTSAAQPHPCTVRDPIQSCKKWAVIDAQGDLGRFLHSRIIASSATQSAAPWNPGNMVAADTPSFANVETSSGARQCGRVMLIKGLLHSEPITSDGISFTISLYCSLRGSSSNSVL